MPTNFASYYDAAIDWKKRLARELPLLAELARQAEGKVLVPACGTGGHVVALAQRGFEVLGFDADDMVEVARRRIEAAAAAIAAAHGKAGGETAHHGRGGRSSRGIQCGVLFGQSPSRSFRSRSVARRIARSRKRSTPRRNLPDAELELRFALATKDQPIPSPRRRNSTRRGPAGEGRGVSC